MRRAVSNRRIRILEFLKVIGQDHADDTSPIMRNAHRTVDQVTNLFGYARLSDVFSNAMILKVDFLLVACTEPAPRLLANQRDNRA